MTIGERLQQHRKDLGLSQEELGQRLLVSRQTVSLWETDQTLPTIDNLLRLKELFGISVDELLEGKKEKQEEQEKPLESYCMTFSAEELMKREKALIWPYVRQILYAYIFVVLSALVRAEYTEASFLLIGFFTCSAVFITISFIRNRKRIRNENERIVHNTYYYDIYRDYYIVRIMNGDVIIDTARVPFSDIKSICNIGDQTALIAENRVDLFRKNELPNDSAIMHLRNEIVLRTQFTTATGVWRFLSILFCILPILIMPFVVKAITWNPQQIASGTQTALSPSEAFRHSWRAFLFLPIPLASIALGFILKKKHFFYKKNIVIGIVIAGILCVYGCFYLIFSKVFG